MITGLLCPTHFSENNIIGSSLQLSNALFGFGELKLLLFLLLNGISNLSIDQLKNISVVTWIAKFGQNLYLSLVLITALFSEYSICKDTGHQVLGLGHRSGQAWCLTVFVVSCIYRCKGFKAPGVLGFLLSLVCIHTRWL